MPELPEVETTTKELSSVLPGKEIIDVWSNYDSPAYKGKDQIKNRVYFVKFKKRVLGKKFRAVERRGKNILLKVGSDDVIVVHMKMTGHLLYGKYKNLRKGAKKSDLPDGVSEKWVGEKWVPEEGPDSPLWDPWNRHIRLVFKLKNGSSLVLSDARKFGKVFVTNSESLEDTEIGDLGPNPLELSFDEFMERINSRQEGAIKQVLMDQSVFAGIGNIYSDEALWASSVDPRSRINKIPETEYKKIYKKVIEVLKKGIRFSGDSTSDYRKPDGKKGNFQKKHKVYKRKGKPCLKRDGGKIKTVKVGGRTAHFCPEHQKEFS